MQHHTVHHHHHDTAIIRYALAAMVFASVLMSPSLELWYARYGRMRPRLSDFGGSTFLAVVSVVNNLVIGISYIVISLTLLHFSRTVQQRIPFLWTFVAFGVFIIACGFTHLVAVVTLWYPTYWSAAAIGLLTAVASVVTAIALPPLVPQVLRLLDTAREQESLRQRVAVLENQRRLVQTIGHELKTPLTVLRGHAQLLRHRGPGELSGEVMAHSLDRLDASAERVVRALDVILSEEPR